MSALNDLKQLLKTDSVTDFSQMVDSRNVPNELSALQGAEYSDVISVFINDCQDTKLKLSKLLPLMQLLTEVQYEQVNNEFDINEFIDEDDSLLTTFAAYSDEGTISTSTGFKWVADPVMMMSKEDVVPLQFIIDINYQTHNCKLWVLSKDDVESEMNTILLEANFYTAAIPSTLDSAFDIVRENWDRHFDYAADMSESIFSMSNTIIKASQMYENLSNSYNVQNIMIAVNNAVANGDANVSDVMTILSDYVNSDSTNIQHVITMIKSFGTNISQHDILSIDRSFVQSFVNANYDTSNKKMVWDASTYHVQGWNVTTFMSVVGNIASTIGNLIVLVAKGIGRILGIALSAIAGVGNAIHTVITNVGNAVGKLNFNANNRLYAQPYLKTNQYWPDTDNVYLDFREYHPDLHAQIMELCRNNGWCVLYAPMIDFYFQYNDDDTITVTGFINMNYGTTWPQNSAIEAQPLGPGSTENFDFSFIRTRRENITIGSTTSSVRTFFFGCDLNTDKVYYRGYSGTPASKYVCGGNKEFEEVVVGPMAYTGNSGGYSILSDVVPTDRSILGLTTTSVDNQVRSRLTKIWSILSCIWLSQTNGVLYLEAGNIHAYNNSDQAFFTYTQEAQLKQGWTSAAPGEHQMIINLLVLAANSTEDDTINHVASWEHIVNSLFDSSNIVYINSTNQDYPKCSLLKAICNTFGDTVLVSTPSRVPKEFYLEPAENSVAALYGSIFVTLGLIATAVTVIAISSFLIKRKLQGKASRLLGQAEAARDAYMENPTEENLKAVRKAAFKANFVCKLGGFGTYNWMQGWFETSSGLSDAATMSLFDSAKTNLEAISDVQETVDETSGSVGTIQTDVNNLSTDLTTVKSDVSFTKQKVITALDHIDASAATTADVYAVTANIDNNLVVVNDNVLSVEGLIKNVDSEEQEITPVQQ